MRKSDFNFELPSELIAQQPLTNRQDSRMLVLNRVSGNLSDQYFSNFVDLLSEKDLLVFNNTLVIPARLYGHKSTGGKIEILVERILGERTALVHLKASKPPKAGDLIRLDGGYFCQMLGREGDLFHIEAKGEKGLPEILEEVGHIPLPPYITRADSEFDRTRYQTIYGSVRGAVAAPTAGLHFDEPTLEKIRLKGIRTVFVTLHVGSGTFQPVRHEDLTQHVMHKEYYEVSEEVTKAVAETKKMQGRIIAVGTTSVRALESAAVGGELQPGWGDTDLFITPGYQFKTVDGLLTNFHLPGSTLIMLVSAFAGYENVMKAYRHAVGESYRFFSYGDAMFVS